MEVLEDDSSLSWNTRLSRTRVSTVQGLGLSQASHLVVQSLGDLLQTVQGFRLKKWELDDVEVEADIGQGETFKVQRCLCDNRVVAVKHIKLGSLDPGSRIFCRRLSSVLLEIRVMHHKPLQSHPNILSLLGYGWKYAGKTPLPYVVVEYGSLGTLRTFLTEKRLGHRAKLILAGDVATGLSALHLCGIVHGDLKLENVIIFQSWDRPCGSVAKLCDFGHSILLTGGEKKQLKYYGTLLYNAPEVQSQTVQVLDPKSLHKCDIWAYGLLLWETIAGGATYFRKSWRTDPSYAHPTSCELPQDICGVDQTSSGTESWLHTSHTGSNNGASEDAHIFGNFDKKNLRSLGKKFADEMFVGAEYFFEKAYVRKLLENTLQDNPTLRISDLSRTPIVGVWNKTSLSAKLAIHVGSSDWTFEMFRVGQGKEIMWEHQQQMLEDFEKISDQQRNFDNTNIAATFQVSICYMLGFGTSVDLHKAATFLRKAEELQHPMAVGFGPRLHGALSDSASPVASHAALVINGFKRQPKAVDGQGETPLIQACREANTSLVMSLLTAEDPDHCTEEGCTLFHWLFMLGDEVTPIVDLLLEKSERKLLNHPCSKPKYLHPQWPLQLVGTPLAFAIAAGSLPGVAAILSLGADPMAPIYSSDPDSASLWTPLHLATKYHLPDILQLLIQYLPGGSRDLLFPGLPLPCALSFSEPIERFAMHASRHNLSLAETAEILPAEAFRLASTEGRTALMHAIDLDDLSVVAVILRRLPALAATRFVDPLEAGSYVYPIHFASQIAAHRDVEEAVEIVNLLVEEHHQSISSRDSKGRMPLHLAVTGLYGTMARWLLLHGTPVNTEDSVGRSALHYCKTETNVNILIDAGANINYTDKAGFSPVHLAALAGSEELTRVLVKRGALLHLKNNEYGTPLHCAIVKRSRGVVFLLLTAKVSVNEKNRDGDTPLHIAARRGRGDLFRVLLDHGADFTTKNKSGFTPFHTAVLSGDTGLVRSSLVACRARISFNVNVVDQKHRTPLHLAAGFAHVEICTILLDQGASVHLQDQGGFTALHAAADASRKDVALFEGNKVRFCSLLCSCAASLTAQTHDGMLPWDLAYHRNEMPLMEFILRKGGLSACRRLILHGQYIGNWLLEEAIAKEDWSFVLALITKGHATGSPGLKLYLDGVRLGIAASRRADASLVKFFLSSDTMAHVQGFDPGTWGFTSDSIMASQLVPSLPRSDPDFWYRAQLLKSRTASTDYAGIIQLLRDDMRLMHVIQGLTYEDGVRLAVAVESANSDLLRSICENSTFLYILPEIN
ncbi:MAG: hypothetical protein M1840_008309 [Geoglossum simile]|nr:MAG: hypothetical protein M1840_008309 [Geoglossum simile]